MESSLTDVFLLAIGICHPVFCLLASVVCEEKSAINLTEDPLHVMNWFSLTAFKVSFWQFDYVSGCGSLLSLSHLEFIELYGCLHWCFSLNRQSLWPLYFQIFFCPISSLLFFWDSYYVCVGTLDGRGYAVCLARVEDDILQPSSLFSNWLHLEDVAWTAKSAAGREQQQAFCWPGSHEVKVLLVRLSLGVSWMKYFLLGDDRPLN